MRGRWLAPVSARPSDRCRRRRRTQAPTRPRRPVRRSGHLPNRRRGRAVPGRHPVAPRSTGHTTARPSPAEPCWVARRGRASSGKRRRRIPPVRSAEVERQHLPRAADPAAPPCTQTTAGRARSSARGRWRSRSSSASTPCRSSPIDSTPCRSNGASFSAVVAPPSANAFLTSQTVRRGLKTRVVRSARLAAERRARAALGRRTAAAARQPQPAAPATVADHRDDGLREMRAAGRGERIPPVPVQNEEQVPGWRVPV